MKSKHQERSDTQLTGAVSPGRQGGTDRANDERQVMGSRKQTQGKLAPPKQSAQPARGAQGVKDRRKNFIESL